LLKYKRTGAVVSASTAAPLAVENDTSGAEEKRASDMKSDYIKKKKGTYRYPEVLSPHTRAIASDIVIFDLPEWGVQEWQTTEGNQQMKGVESRWTYH
jgi:hypothetical protein